MVGVKYRMDMFVCSAKNFRLFFLLKLCLTLKPTKTGPHICALYYNAVTFEAYLLYGYAINVIELHTT